MATAEEIGGRSRCGRLSDGEGSSRVPCGERGRQSGGERGVPRPAEGADLPRGPGRQL